MRVIVLGEMMLSIHLQHDALAPREEEQKVHALARKREAMAQGFYDSGIIVKIDLRQEGRQRLGKNWSIDLEIRGG
jgi:hypothetical protein